MENHEELGKLMSEYQPLLQSIADMQKELYDLAQGIKRVGERIQYNHQRRLTWDDIEITESGLKNKYSRDDFELTPSAISRFVELTNNLADAREKKRMQDNLLTGMGYAGLIKHA